LTPGAPFPPLSRRYENENGESAWVAPYADEDGGELVDGRKLKAGWKRCSDDEGDVVSASRAPLLHPLAHHPDCSHHASLNSSITAQWYENTEGEVRDEKERTLPRLRQRPCRPLTCLPPPPPLSQSSWTPPFADDDETPAYETDGPGGARLKDGWKRCSDDEGDVWCVFFSGCAYSHFAPCC
jgi:hypothetical protein